MANAAAFWPCASSASAQANDASAAALITISGGSASRVFLVAPGTVVSMNDLVISDGAAAPTGGGILNFGDLSLERVVVTNNVQNAAGPASFDLGGGGIYNGDGATLIEPGGAQLLTVKAAETTYSYADQPNPNGAGGAGGFWFFVPGVESAKLEVIVP